MTLEERQFREADWPEANPSCLKCKGAGFLYPWDGFLKKARYDVVIPCDSPGCLVEAVRAFQQGEPFLRTRGVSPRQTFDNFRMVEGAKEAYEAAEAFATGNADFVFLLIYGGVGNGKTHLCNSVALVLNKHGVHTQLFTVADLLSELRAKIAEDTIETQVDRLKKFPALILDDFKPEYQTDWAISRLEEIIDYRYRNCLPTMMTTNRQLSELPERILSRFSDATIAKRVLNKAGDFRRSRVIERKVNVAN